MLGELNNKYIRHQNIIVLTTDHDINKIQFLENFRYFYNDFKICERKYVSQTIYNIINILPESGSIIRDI